jgi:hypothetical protein
MRRMRLHRCAAVASTILVLTATAFAQAVPPSPREQVGPPVGRWSLTDGVYEWVYQESWIGAAANALQEARNTASRVLGSREGPEGQIEATFSEMNRMQFNLPSEVEVWGPCRHRLIIDNDPTHGYVFRSSVFGELGREKESSRWELALFTKDYCVYRNGSHRLANNRTVDELFVHAPKEASTNDDLVVSRTNAIAEQAQLIMSLATPVQGRAGNRKAWHFNHSQIGALVERLPPGKALHLPPVFGAAGQAAVLTESDIGSGSYALEIVYTLIGGTYLKTQRLTFNRARVPVEFGEVRYVPFTQHAYYECVGTLMNSNSVPDPVTASDIIDKPFPCTTGTDFRWVEDSGFGFNPAKDGILTRERVEAMCAEGEKEMRDAVLRQQSVEEPVPLSRDFPAPHVSFMAEDDVAGGWQWLSLLAGVLLVSLLLLAILLRRRIVP